MIMMSYTLFSIENFIFLYHDRLRCYTDIKYSVKPSQPVIPYSNLGYTEF